MTVLSSHHDLIRRAQAADPQALTAIYERFAPGIYRYIYFRVGDPELARDIHSDVFVRMLEGIGRYEDRGWSIGSWLYRIAHARTVDSLRRRDRQAQHPLQDDSAQVEGPDAGIDSQVSRELVERGMAHLSESHRLVVRLRFIYGLSLEETASQMGRSIGSVKALQHRAMARLAAVLRDDVGDALA